MSYTDDQLQLLMQEPESHWIERKESFSGKDKVCATVCAFANDIANSGRAGVIWIGMRDDGVVSGIDANDDLLQKIDQIHSDGRIQPLPSLSIRTLQAQGQSVIAIVVTPSKLPPVRFDGRLWVRLSASTQQGNAENERTLNERRRSNANRSFDSEGVPTATIEELNLRYFDEVYLPTVISRDVLAANGRSMEEKLATTRMAIGVNPSLPTVAGLLTMAYSPQDWLAGAYVQYVRYAGREQGGDIVDQAVLTGTLETVIRQTEEKLKALILTPTRVSGIELEQRMPDYPLDALQQLFRNAVMHRNYEGTNTPIRVYCFEDRIEIVNPGGPYGMVNNENFGQPHVTDYRNPTIAEVLRNLGFVQRFGFGIQNARTLLQRNGNPPPEFDTSAGLVAVTIRKANT